MTFGALVRAWFESLPTKGINEHRARLILESKLGECAPAEVTQERVDALLPNVPKQLRPHVRNAAKASLGAEEGPPLGEDDDESAPTPWGMSLSQCAGMLGVSRERVREIERRALAKMRQTLEAKGVSFTDLLPTRPGPGPE